MADTISVAQTQANTYDAVPYESNPYSNSNPGYLSAVATLFGMNPPKLDNAKILELGCASGGNILPIAVRYPNAKCVGVDLSKVQIDFALAQVKELGLKNMEFKCMSITDIGKSLGQFDYIVCHGVLSWVPENVREAIFKTCGELLTPNGLAYISYNTLPGWNTVKTIRDMMLYHSSMFEHPAEKVQQSRLLLDFVKDSVQQENNPYAEILKRESAILSQQPDYYLFHDHLEENNHAYYFRDFMAQAARNSLQYVGDCSVASMFLGNMPAAVAEKLQVVNDIVRTEQYMDFLNNRRFRMSILSKAGAQINRNLTPDSIKNLHLNMRVVAAKPITEVKLEDLTDQAQFFFQGNKDTAISSTSPVMKAALYTFAENWNNPLAFDEIVKQIQKKLPKAKADEIAAELGINAMRMILSGHISISEAPKFINTLSKKPVVSELVRFQAANMPTLWVTNEMHERIGINILEKYLLRYLDGKHTAEDLTAKMIAHVDSGELNISKEGAELKDKAAVKTEMAMAVTQTLEKLKSCALLVA